MAGPSAAVLLATSWTDAEIVAFRDWLAEIFVIDSGGWWLRDAQRLGMSSPTPMTGPLFVDVGEPEHEDPEEIAALTKAAGFPPETEIVLSAATSGRDSHELLGRLALAVARRYGGIIDLTGPLPADAESLPGHAYAIPYRTVDDEFAVYHLVDAELLVSWLEHPRFRMVK
ncbi:DUF6368 family protein [Actinoplanes sp. NBC_00393]|uniref:DUF6368 family protein n=1 Tax=Actinoplanes sp. NBC_00393 TaxID=2975953 RepID=UPI002E1BA385